MDGSAVGCVARGETYEEALHREVMEELNIDMQEREYRLLGKFSPHKHGTYCMSYVYEMKCDEVPDYDTQEFSEYFWLTPQEVIDKIQQGEKAKRDMRFFMSELFLKKL